MAAFHKDAKIWRHKLSLTQLPKRDAFTFRPYDY